MKSVSTNGVAMDSRGNFLLVIGRQVWILFETHHAHHSIYHELRTTLRVLAVSSPVIEAVVGTYSEGDKLLGKVNGFG